jgi:arylsulfatase A-like enzyme
MTNFTRKWFGLLVALALTATTTAAANAQQQPQQKPNILFIMGDDIGGMQPSIYHRGLMVGETPNIDRIGNEGAVFSAEDWMQTLLAAVGEADLKAKLMQGAMFGAKTFKVHLDGYDQRNLLKNAKDGPRKEFFYWTDDGGLAGLRCDKWKLAFMEQRSHGFDV